MSSEQIILLIVGLLVAIAGVVLLFQGLQKESPDSKAGVKSAFISVSGPPGLVLAVTGVVMMVFPFSPLWPEKDGSDGSTSTTASSEATATSLGPAAMPNRSSARQTTPGTPTASLSYPSSKPRTPLEIGSPSRPARLIRSIRASPVRT